MNRNTALAPAGRHPADATRPAALPPAGAAALAQPRLTALPRRLVAALLACLLALSFALPARAIEIEEVTSPGGITAWLVADHAIPFTALEIRFRGGASLDRPGKRGEVNLMTALLEEGSGEMDSQAYAEATEALAARIGFDVGPDALAVSARMLTENRDEAAALIRQALSAPHFDAAAFERVRAQVLSIIRSDAMDPSAIAAETFRSLAHGDHPYGSSTSGTLESVGGLTPGDMAEALARVVARDRIIVAAVGDITADDLGRLLDTIFGDLPEEGAALPPRAEDLLTGGVTVVDHPTPQATVIFGQAGIGMDDPDFFPAFVANHILGGGSFTSRLMTEVRERRGLTYGIGTYIVNRDLADLWQGSFASGNARVAEAVDVTRAEWARLAEEGVTPEELAAAQTYMTGAYPLRFDGNAQIADILAGMQMSGMDRDYVNTRNAQIEAVTVEDIARVAARILDADALRFVVVGEPEGLGAD